MPMGDSGDFEYFDFEIKFPNSHMKHHFLFTPGIYREDIYPGKQLQVTTNSIQETRNMACDGSMMETLIEDIHDLECSP